VTGTFVQVSPAVSNADYYLEVGFTSTAGSLANSTSSGELLVGFHKSNWSNFNQLNDYSFDRTKTSFADWNRIELYRSGILVWGIPPTSGTPAPTNTPTNTRTPTSTIVASTAAPTVTPGNSPTPPPNMIRLQYRAGNSLASNDNIEPAFNIINNTSSAIPLSEFKIRYYFTRDTAKPLVFTCEYADLGCAKTTGTFVPMSPTVDGADYYLEVGFTSTAGNLAANGQTGDTLVRINKSDWSDFNQLDDYSFDGTKISYADSTRAALYRNDTLVWGEPPSSAPGNVAATFEP
jgi:endoglucanase